MSLAYVEEQKDRRACMPHQLLIDPGELARQRPGVPGVEKLVELVDQEMGGRQARIEPRDCAGAESDKAQALEPFDDISALQGEPLAALAGEARARELEELSELWIDQRGHGTRHPG